jgi:hypothetical protein
LRANAGVDISTLPYPSSFAFPPSQFLADISKRVVEFWKVLEPSEIAEWSELACDIRIAHAQLVATFGNGIVFDGKDWEEQRQYHARTLYFKWMGLQAVRGAAGTSDNSLAYAPVYMTQVVSIVNMRLTWRSHPSLSRKSILSHMENRSKELLIRT